jgi:hypothetical protein
VAKPGPVVGRHIHASAIYYAPMELKQHVFIYIFNSKLKTFYSQHFTLVPRYEWYIKGAENLPTIQLPRITLLFLIRVPISCR